MRKKLLYEQPDCELLVVRFEEGLLTVTTDGNTINNATYDEWEEEL